MSTQHPEQVVRPDPWTLFCADCSQKNENYDGYTSPGGKELPLGMPYTDRRVGYEKK